MLCADVLVVDPPLSFAPDRFPVQSTIVAISINGTGFINGSLVASVNGASANVTVVSNGLAQLSFVPTNILGSTTYGKVNFR